MMGQAIAETWRPAWHNIPYGLLLAVANHFLDCALFGGSWGNWVHYLLDVGRSGRHRAVRASRDAWRARW